MPPKGKKRTLENDDASPIAKKSSSTSDQHIIDAAAASAGPTAKQLDPLERQRRLAAYKTFLNRGGPDAPGSKDVPQGAGECLKSLTFVITGVLPSLEREECKKIIQSYGGRVTTAVSGKTDYLVAGRDAGKSKTDKAAKLRIKLISEDDLLEMIRTQPGNKNADAPAKQTPIKARKSTGAKASDAHSLITITSTSKEKKQDDGVLWVEKYQPTSLSQIVGQQTEKSAMKKLIYFLTNWHTWHATAPTSKKRKATASFTAASSTDPSKYRGVLLIGPPGSGKTTTAQLVCKALNLPYTEQNASDNRSQRTIGKIELNSSYLTGATQSIDKHVLIMDEVDGVSGSEDRGGLQTIIKQLQTTRIPIIFIANDRQAGHMRTLANYCYEIKFDRPSFLNVKSYILDICSREHLRITHGSLDSLIHASNRDIRHILHTLNLFYQQSSSVLTNLTKSEKALSTSPFDACMKMFSTPDLTVMDKSNLYFHDYSLVPLLIQDNYLRVVPSITAERKPVGTQQRMELISKAADSFTWGDVCSKLNFINNNRSLISYQSMFSGVIPSSYLHGSLTVVHFPSWLSRIQQQKTTNRQLIELETHCSLKSTSIHRDEFNLDYLPIFHRLLTDHLHHRQLTACVRLMNEYYLSDDDLQMILSLSTYRQMTTSKAELDAKTKTSLSKLFQKHSQRTPFRPIDPNRLTSRVDAARENDDDDDYIVSTNDDDPDKENPRPTKTIVRPSNPSRKRRRK